MVEDAPVPGGGGGRHTQRRRTRRGASSGRTGRTGGSGRCGRAQRDEERARVGGDRRARLDGEERAGARREGDGRRAGQPGGLDRLVAARQAVAGHDGVVGGVEAHDVGGHGGRATGSG